MHDGVRRSPGHVFNLPKLRTTSVRTVAGVLQRANNIMEVPRACTDSDFKMAIFRSFLARIVT